MDQGRTGKLIGKNGNCGAYHKAVQQPRQNHPHELSGERQAQNRPVAVEEIEPIKIHKPDEECHCSDTAGRASQKLF